MDTLIVAILVLGAASALTIRWLAKAPLGYEDEKGFHLSPEKSMPPPEKAYPPIGPTVRPALLRRELSRIR